MSSEAHFCGGTRPVRLEEPTFPRPQRFSGVLTQAPPSAAFRPSGFRESAAQTARSGWHWCCGLRSRRVLLRRRRRKNEAGPKGDPNRRLNWLVTKNTEKWGILL